MNVIEKKIGNDSHKCEVSVYETWFYGSFVKAREKASVCPYAPTVVRNI
jgi:hypothetical protein